MLDALEADRRFDRIVFGPRDRAERTRTAGFRSRKPRDLRGDRPAGFIGRRVHPVGRPKEAGLERSLPEDDGRKSLSVTSASSRSLENGGPMLQRIAAVIAVAIALTGCSPKELADLAYKMERWPGQRLGGTEQPIPADFEFVNRWEHDLVQLKVSGDLLPHVVTIWAVAIDDSIYLWTAPSTGWNQRIEKRPGRLDSRWRRRVCPARLPGRGPRAAPARLRGIHGEVRQGYPEALRRPGARRGTLRDLLSPGATELTAPLTTHRSDSQARTAPPWSGLAQFADQGGS